MCCSVLQCGAVTFESKLHGAGRAVGSVLQVCCKCVAVCVAVCVAACVAAYGAVCVEVCVAVCVAVS